MYSFIGAFWMHLWEIDKNVGKGIGRCTSLRATWRSLERGWTKQLDWGENLLCIWHLFCICIYCITTYICYFLPKYLTLFQKRVSFHLIFLLFSGNESIFFHLYPSNLLFSRKEEVLGAAVKNFLILEKSKFHWDKPQNMDSFPEKSKKYWRKFTLFRKEEVLRATVKNFLILEKSKFHWDKPKNMASFQKRGSFRSSCQKLPHSRKE